MLNASEQIKLQKKLNALRAKQKDERTAYLRRRHLDKDGDANWQRYVKKCVAIFDKLQRKERRYTSRLYIRALYNLRKGIESPHINI